jgi:hypothetical protein
MTENEVLAKSNNVQIKIWSREVLVAGGESFMLLIAPGNSFPGRFFFAAPRFEKSSTALLKSAVGFHVVQNGIENAIDKLAAFLRAEPFCDLDGFVNRHFWGYILKVEEFANAHAEEDLVDQSDSVKVPVGCFLFDDRVDGRLMLDSAVEKTLSKRKFFLVIAELAENVFYYVGEGILGDFKSIERLHDPFPNDAALVDLVIFFHCSLLNGCATFRNRASADAVQESFFTLRYEKRGMEATLFHVVVRFENRVIVSEWRHAATSRKGTGRTMNPSTRSRSLSRCGGARLLRETYYI